MCCGHLCAGSDEEFGESLASRLIAQEASRATIGVSRVGRVSRNTLGYSSYRDMDLAGRKASTSERPGGKRHRVKGSTGHYETCGKCKKTGHLIMCDSCDEAYHFRCTGLDMHPSDDEPYYCKECIDRLKRQKTT